MQKANPKIAAKYFPKQTKVIDTVRSREDYRKNNDVLMDAYRAWLSLDAFREKSRRNKMYVFEDQWGDKVTVKNRTMTERRSIIEQGNIPLQNNRIRGIVRSVVGVFQSQQTEPVCAARNRDKQMKGEMMSLTLQYVYQLNKLWGIDSSNLNYFLITGLAAFKSLFGWRNNKMDIWTDIVNYNHIFFDNHIQDPRHWDCHLIGEIYDVGLYDVMQQFAFGDRNRAEAIRRIYGYCNKEQTVEYLENITRDTKADLDFFVPSDDSRCRVIEVWRKESKERLLVHDSLTGEYYKAETSESERLDKENAERILEQSGQGVAPDDMRLIKYEWFIDNYWYYYFLSPQGDVLDEGETPFWHESHPYSFRVYPFFDGQVFPFVGDFIDQQRYINRIITLWDFMIRAAAKGVLIIDESSIPDGYTFEDVADEWHRFNGSVLYTTKKNPNAKPPAQITSNASQLGQADMLQIHLKLLEDISGVQGAMQGRTPTAGTPAALYAQQVQNSTTSLTELFEAYRELREERDYKNMKLIQQFYTDRRYIHIAGKGVRNEPIVYDPDEVRNTEFELSITESVSTPAYRMIMNEFLMQLFSAGQITLSELLENGAFPFADKLLQAINGRQQAMAGGMNGEPGQADGALVPTDIQQQLDQRVNPLVQKMLANSNAYRDGI
ncbi:MAG: hypothetical protein LBS46_00945 [Dysgonamonadaceae bacterium]|jgi:hypothetical protein|nr:hypothetical protein [Dysgonamonadaceae bacterium]